MATSIDCPQCHRPDRVRKASGIYQSSMRPGRLAPSSQLADSLGPPGWVRRPLPDRVLGALVFGLGVLGVLGGGVSFVNILLALLSPGAGANSGVLGELLHVLTLLGFAAVVVGGLLLAKSGRARMQDAYLLPGYSRAYVVWEQLFYCSRCDVVYLPGETFVMPSAQVPNWLNSSEWGKQR
jgi:hypothetical protein